MSRLHGGGGAARIYCGFLGRVVLGFTRPSVRALFAVMDRLSDPAADDPPPDLDLLKAAARREARRQRRGMADPAAGPSLAAAFPFALLGPGLVAGYWPLGSEIDSRPLMERLSFSGANLCLPRVASRDGAATYHLWRLGDPLLPDAFGLLAPPESAPAAGAPRMILCPLLAFDRSGARLGQGGGHYDRLLAALKPQGACAVGLAYAEQERAGVPMGPLDQRLDWIVTEREAIQSA